MQNKSLQKHMDLHASMLNFLTKNLKIHCIKNYTMESWVGCLGFDRSVLAKIIAYWFYSSFYDGVWPNFGVC